MKLRLVWAFFLYISTSSFICSCHIDYGEETTITNFDGDEVLDENDSPLKVDELFIGMTVGAKWHGNVHYRSEVKSRIYISGMLY